MATFATSVLLQFENADGTVTTSHTLHWTDAACHDEAIAAAVANAKKLKPHLQVVDAIGGNRGQAGIKPVLTHKPFGYVKSFFYSK